MLRLRCTQKVLKELGGAPAPEDVPAAGDSVLGDWYVNLFTVDRRKTFLFMNEKTLLSFVIYGIKKSNVQQMPLAFVRGLAQLLELEGLPEPAIRRALVGTELVMLARTDSRRLLGNLNDLVSMYRHAILWEGGLAACNLGRIIADINRTPQRNIGWGHSIDLARELLARETGYAS